MEGEKPLLQVEAESALLKAIKENLADIVFVGPTLPVTVLFRRNVGFRVVKLPVIYLGFVLLSLFGWAAFAVAGAAGQTPIEGVVFILGAFAYAGLAIFWRQTHWAKIKRQELWHTRSRGVSYLSKVIPINESSVQRFVEPAICMVLGLALIGSFHFFAAWLILSALGLLILEQIIYDAQLNAMLDQYDGIIDAATAGRYAELFSGESDSDGQKAPTIEECEGVAVVVAPELRAMIEQRRAQKEAKFKPELLAQAVVKAPADSEVNA